MVCKAHEICDWEAADQPDNAPGRGLRTYSVHSPNQVVGGVPEPADQLGRTGGPGSTVCTDQTQCDSKGLTCVKQVTKLRVGVEQLVMGYRNSGCEWWIGIHRGHGVHWGHGLGMEAILPKRPVRCTYGGTHRALRQQGRLCHLSASAVECTRDPPPLSLLQPQALPRTVGT